MGLLLKCSGISVASPIYNALSVILVLLVISFSCVWLYVAVVDVANRCRALRRSAKPRRRNRRLGVTGVMVSWRANLNVSPGAPAALAGLSPPPVKVTTHPLPVALAVPNTHVAQAQDSGFPVHWHAETVNALYMHRRIAASASGMNTTGPLTLALARGTAGSALGPRPESLATQATDAAVLSPGTDNATHWHSASVTVTSGHLAASAAVPRATNPQATASLSDSASGTCRALRTTSRRAIFSSTGVATGTAREAFAETIHWH